MRSPKPTAYVAFTVGVHYMPGTPLDIKAAVVRALTSSDFISFERDDDLSVEIVEHTGSCDKTTCGNDDARLSHAEGLG